MNSAGDTAAVGRTVDGGEDEDHGGAAKVTLSVFGDHQGIQGIRLVTHRNDGMRMYGMIG